MLQMFRFSRLLFWLGGAGILILSTMAVIFYVMPPIRDTGDIVYLQADETPFKVRPSEEGGLKIAHQNSRFMSYLDKGEAETEEKEILHLNEICLNRHLYRLTQRNPVDTAPALSGRARAGSCRYEKSGKAKRNGNTSGTGANRNPAGYSR